MIENTSVPFVVSNPRKRDNPIIMCNTAFIELTGYDRIEILGRNCRFLAGKDTQAEHTQLIVKAIRNHQPVLVEILNYKKDGTPFRNALMIAPIFDDVGELVYFLGSQMELTEINSLTLSKKRDVAHRAEILNKMNVTTTAESIRIAVEAGL